MWNIFKESVWKYLLGKVFSVIGLVGFAQTVVSLFNPDYVITVAGVKIDYRAWVVLTLLLAIGIVLRVLRVADRYKALSERVDNIRIVYNESNYSTCREPKENREIIRVGYRVIGKQMIEDPIVLASSMFRVDSVGKSTKIPIVSTPLSAMVEMSNVHPGFTPSYWVGVFERILGTPIIELCYRSYQSQPICLSVGRYELNLVAQGTPSRGNFAKLIITIKEDCTLDLAIEGVDVWNT